MSKAPNKKENPAYLVITPVEDLIDEGIQFEGDSPKDQALNQFDFSRLREIIQRFDGNITGDQRETLIRCLKCCVKAEFLLQ